MKTLSCGAVLCAVAFGNALFSSHAAKADAQEKSSSSSPIAALWDRRDNPAAKQEETWFQNYRFRDGETSPRLRIHYATLGSPRRDDRGNINNAVLMLHWTGADSRALLSPTFVNTLYAPGRPLDATRYFLIFPDDIGHGQSSKPSDGLKAHFPKYVYGDMVDLQHKLVTETLGIKHLHAIVGMSMGGMHTWQWAEAYPEAMDGVMPIVSLPVKVSGRNLLWRRMIIDAILSDPEWNGGNYTKNPPSLLLGFEVLRMMLDGVPRLQAVIPDSISADHFLDQTRSMSQGIDANNMLYSLQASSDYDPEPALTSIKAKVFALNFSDDEIDPDQLQILEHLIKKVAHGSYLVQTGSAESYGHLTIAHPDLWARQVGSFMKSIETNPSVRQAGK